MILQLSLNDAVWPPPIPFEDRFLVGIQTYADPVPQDRKPHYGPLLGQKILSIDACGGDVKVVAEGVEHIYIPEREGQPWLGHRNQEQLVWLDPTGNHPPRTVDSAGPQSKHQRAGDSIVLDSDGSLVRVEFEADGSQQATELGAVERGWVAVAQPGGETVDTVLTLDGWEIVEIDVATAARRTLREAAYEFTVSSNRRFFVWWPRPDPSVSPRPPDPEPRLWDRQTDAEVVIGAGMELRSVYLGDGGVAAIDSDWNRTELTFYADLSQVRVDGAFSVAAGGADGSLLLWTGGPRYGALHSFSVGDTSPLLRGRDGVQNRYMWADEDAYWSVEQIDGSAPSANPGEPYPGTHANLVRFAYGGTNRETVWSEVWDPLMLTSGSWVTTRNYEEGLIGELWLLAGNGEEHLLDREVLTDLSLFNQNLSLARTRRMPAVLEDDWLYFVLDRTGERHGIWRARIEPAD